jgi:hypothetical protein
MGLNLKSTSSKVLASAALLAAAAGVAGMGTYGGFTSTTSASAAVVNSGTVKFDVGAAGAANRLTAAASGLVPGDIIQRAVTLTNSGDQDLAAVTLTTTAVAPSSKLDSDAANGLQIKVEACKVPWVETATSSTAYTYTCSVANTTTVMTTRAVLGANMPLTGLASLTAKQADNLRVTLSLPDSADNSFQGKSSTISFSFDAVQRAAASK